MKTGEHGTGQDSATERWERELRDEMKRGEAAQARLARQQLQADRTERGTQIATTVPALATAVLSAAGAPEPWGIGTACATMALCLGQLWLRSEDQRLRDNRGRCDAMKRAAAAAAARATAETVGWLQSARLESETITGR